jgi:hypothetical protein
VRRIYHRLESPTQTVADAVRQAHTLRICGRVARYGAVPSVKAYVGELPPGRRGVEFETEIAPYPGSAPHLALWYADMNSVEDHGDGLVCIAILRLRNGQEC